MAGSGEFTLDRIEHNPAASWTDYVRGMALFLEEAGHRLTGFDGLIHSTVPFASGLSSSAAIEMAAGSRSRRSAASASTRYRWR